MKNQQSQFANVVACIVPKNLRSQHKSNIKLQTQTNSKNYLGAFRDRHIDPDETRLHEMLGEIGVSSLDELIDQTIPSDIRLQKPMVLPKAKTEQEYLHSFKALLGKNKIYHSYIGMGYYPTITPPVLLRNILENPNWYTAYTPYQPEIAQGRLEALLNFQTMVIDLTGMEIANASMLDEATAAAEAMVMMHHIRARSKANANKLLVSSLCHRQTIDVLKSRAEPIGLCIEVVHPSDMDASDETVFGLFLQYPGNDGSIHDFRDLALIAKVHDVLIGCAADLLSLTLLSPPGELGADVVVGTTQRFGTPMAFGGPHAAYFATWNRNKRHIPGRIVGVSKDTKGRKALRIALQTREQHIRRDKATSNICTSSVLTAIMASFYAVYHGPQGLRNIAERIHSLTTLLNKHLHRLGISQLNPHFFDTLSIQVHPSTREKIRQLAESKNINFRYYGTSSLSISLDETTSLKDIQTLLEIFANVMGKVVPTISDELMDYQIPKSLLRSSTFLTHEVFNSYHTEHELLRYLKRLESKDLSLVHSMIPLGSCTMKLSATSTMIPITWPEIANIHPFSPPEQTQGYRQFLSELENSLCVATGFDAASLQPNSGAQGEYAGLLAIREFHKSRGDGQRTIALIPASAHGTNPASAVMAGMQVVVVRCQENGNIDMEDLQRKAEHYKSTLAALMVTYPSTHGVFEENIREVCEIIHRCGGKVYMDGANMNAQVGLTSPGFIGADVCHLNLHKTFGMPHGGGGPGIGPICVKSDLAPFLPKHWFFTPENQEVVNAVASAPWGSAGIAAIAYGYISMMGRDGLEMATKTAILNANYLKSRLEKYYPILFTGKNGRCAHEFILDCRQFQKTANITAEDITKRLMDYGFHAPTVSFPVRNTLMIEPTESETKEELDRFCEAMIAIRLEIKEIEEKASIHKEYYTNNILTNAPHTVDDLTADVWDRPYRREKAAFPLPWLHTHKFWPSVNRLDAAYGDRNFVCSCRPIEEYTDHPEPLHTTVLERIVA